MSQEIKVKSSKDVSVGYTPQGTVDSVERLGAVI